MAYNYTAAIKAGANPTDVLNYLGTQTGYNYQGALKAGAKQNDVLKYMSTLPFKTAKQGDGAPGSQFGGGGSTIKNIGTDFAARRQNVQQIDSSNISVPSKILQNIGQIAGGVSDIVGEAGKAIGLDKVIGALPVVVDGKLTTVAKGTPQFISEIKKNAANIKAVQDVSDKFNEFAKNHPEATGDVQALFNVLGAYFSASGVSDLATIGVKGATEDVAKTAAEEGKTAEGVTKEAQPPEAKAAEQIDSNKPTKTPSEKLGATSNPFLKVQRLVTSVPSIVKGSIKTIADILKRITDPKLYEDTVNQLKTNFSDIMKSAKESLSNPDASAPHDIAGQNAVKPALDELNAQKDAVGAKVTEYKNAIGSKIVSNVSDIYNGLRDDVEKIFGKKFIDSVEKIKSGSKVSAEDFQKAIEGVVGGLSNVGKVSLDVGSTEKAITKVLVDLKNGIDGISVDDLNRIKSNIGNIIAKIGKDAPSIASQTKRIFTKVSDAISKSLDAIAKENGISDFNQVNEDYSNYKKYVSALTDITDKAGNIDYTAISKNATDSAMKSTIDFLQSKTGIPVRAYSEFASWAEKAYSDSKVNDLLKSLLVKTAGLPMMGIGRQIGNLIGDVPGKTFDLIDSELEGGATELANTINKSSALKAQLKRMGIDASQGALMLITGQSINQVTNTNKEQAIQ